MNLKTYLKTVEHGGFQSFLKRAQELGVRIELLPHEKVPVLKLSHGGRVFFCYKRNMPLFRRMGNLTRHKVITKMVLESVGIRTPRGIVAASVTEAVSEIRKKKLRYPVIVKPVDGSLAKGVTWNIASKDEVATAVRHALGAYGKRRGIKIMVEEMFIGREHRVLVFNGKVLSCVEKVPAGVTGNGSSPIGQLIKAFNKTRRHGYEIKLDKTARQTLKAAGYTLGTVLPAGFFFQFRHNLNMSDGGRSIDRTKEMNPALKRVCVKAVEAAGLTYGGLDLIVKNIRSAGPSYVILEINPNPFYNMHEKPLVEGRDIDVSETILKTLFPKLKTKKR